MKTNRFLTVVLALILTIGVLSGCSDLNVLSQKDSMIAPDDSITYDSTEPDSNEPGSTETESTKPDSTKPDPTKPDSTKPDPTKPDPTKPDSTKPDPTKPEPTKPEPTKPEPTKPEPTKPEPTQPDPTQKPTTPPDDGSKDVYEKTVSILFVGNSFVYTNNVPLQLSEISRLYGIKVNYKTICPGGATLSLTLEQAISMMKNEKFDYAVFQDYGTRPTNDTDGFLSNIKTLCDTAKKYGITPVLYNPAWANIGEYPDENYQNSLTEIYAAAAKSNNAILVNAGDAWVYAYKKIEDISLYKGSGDYHANAAGAYYTSCVFASTLFNLHIKDVTIGKHYYKNDENAIILGQAAWEFVSYYKTNNMSPKDVVTVDDGTNKKINK